METSETSGVEIDRYETIWRRWAILVDHVERNIRNSLGVTIGATNQRCLGHDTTTQITWDWSNTIITEFNCSLTRQNILGSAQIHERECFGIISTSWSGHAHEGGSCDNVVMQGMNEIELCNQTDVLIRKDRTTTMGDLWQVRSTDENLTSVSSHCHFAFRKSLWNVILRTTADLDSADLSNRHRSSPFVPIFI
ncbi:hypothetical protein D3C86_1318540 [compost metagenome]